MAGPTDGEPSGAYPGPPYGAIERGRQVTGGATHLFEALDKSPDMLRSYERFGARLLRHGQLDAALREMVILRVAWLARCDYEWFHHVRIAEEVGLDATQVDWARSGSTDPNLDVATAAAMRAAEQLFADGRIETPLWDQLTSRHGAGGAIELAMLVGNYQMLAGLIRSLDLEIEPAAESAAGYAPLPTAERRLGDGRMHGHRR